MKVRQYNNSQQLKISNYNAKNDKNQNNQVAFKGITPVLDYLATNPVWGATAVDVGSMGTPRTAVDTYNRGASAGFETGFREYSSTVNDAALGLYGVAAGSILAGMLGKNIKNPQRIFASNDSIDVHSNIWKSTNGDVNNYINTYVDSIKGFNPHNPNADAKGYVGISEEYKQGIIDDMKKLASDKLTNKQDKKTNKLRERITARLNSKLVEATGAESEFVLKHGDKTVSSSVQTVTDDFYRMTKALKENGAISKVDGFVTNLKKFGKGRAALGLGAAMAISACFQPFNVWMTKKRTGSDGFAGMEGREKDNSVGFKAMKAASAAAMATVAMVSLNAKPTQLLDKMLFKGVAPTIDQFKGLYATTICSRMLSARDKDELRECDTKDILGFLNWLVLGNFVEKGVVTAMESKDNPIIRYNSEGRKDKFLYKHFGEKVDRFFNGNISSRRELLTEALKAEGKPILDAKGNAKKIGQMLDEVSKTSAVRKNLKIRNIAQVANYVYSGLVLGAGIPYLNISITESLSKKRHNKKIERVMSIDNQNYVDSKSQANSTFLEMKTQNVA